MDSCSIARNLYSCAYITMRSKAQPNYDAIYKTPVAPVRIATHADKIIAIDWLHANCHSIFPRSKLSKQVCRSLEDYFKKACAFPAYNFHLQGTSFQKRIWKALQKIPPGGVLAYGQLAKKLNTSSRAIAQACRTKLVAIIIPCHRIVAATGLGGYSGIKKRTGIKQWLLRYEGVEL